MDVILHDFKHDRPFDVGLMLVSPSGKGVNVMYRVGGNHRVGGVVITLDDQATKSMSTVPDDSVTSGRYRPSVGANVRDVFPAPAPLGVTASTLANFTGEDPNGDWRLYVIDNSFLFRGEFATGWSLSLTYEIPAPIPPKPKPPKKRRRRKKRTGRR